MESGNPVRNHWNVNRPPTHTFSECWGREMTASFGKRCPREQRSLFGLFSWFERSVLIDLNVPREATRMQQHAGKCQCSPVLLLTSRVQNLQQHLATWKTLAFWLKLKQESWDFTTKPDSNLIITATTRYKHAMIYFNPMHGSDQSVSC